MCTDGYAGQKKGSRVSGEGGDTVYRASLSGDIMRVREIEEIPKYKSKKVLRYDGIMV